MSADTSHNTRALDDPSVADTHHLTWDPNIESFRVREVTDLDGERWLISITPMLFNDRILLTSLDRDYPLGWTAGWCYDKGGAAIHAALLWDFPHQASPVGWKKIAADGR